MWSYESVSIDFDRIEKRYLQTLETLNHDAGKRKHEAAAKENLQSMGRMLCDEVLPFSVKQALRNSQARFLILRIDERLVHIPWELIYIDGYFLCERFAIGRRVKTPQKVFSQTRRMVSTPPKMWIVTAADKQNQKEILEEAKMICRKVDRLNVADEIIETNIDSNVTSERIRERLMNYDFVHFAGHAEFDEHMPENSGWKVSEGYFSARDMMKMAGSGQMPAMVFSNACQSGRTLQWNPNRECTAFGLANAFMISGVQHYVGTFWDIADHPGARFADFFYDRFFSGEAVGEAVRQARNKMISEFDPHCSGWASYMLYGDPRTRYFDPIPLPVDHTGRSEPVCISSRGNSEAPLPEDMTLRKKKKLNKKRTFGFAVFMLIGMITLYVFSGYTYIPYLSESEATKRLEIMQNQANRKKERIDRLLQEVEQLAPGRSKIMEKDAAIQDSWRSAPLTLSVDFDFQTAVLDYHEKKMIASVIESELLERTRVTLVERLSLDVILEELKRANSSVVAPGKSIIPELLPASLILFVELNGSGADAYVTMHLADTAKGSVIDVIIESINMKLPVVSQKKKLADNLVSALKTRYPLRGVISKVEKTDIILNIGAEAGVKLDQRFRAVDHNVTFQVVSIEENQSQMIVEKDVIPAQAGWRLEAL